ncbi:hypothetical protein [Amycolatopsis keratiniphila]|uniref:hypothetical protein n=1 Tax=Amycolatopsis keratiniphila TaxID=129921 RepID=UPI00097B99FE|nr:hypothetical protein [Amycolatopsis keratiniphila]OLZ51567.1 hypothetical protein BS330_27215 [Amycolatopsis keratiniphila subsp. nogabecina]
MGKPLGENKKRTVFTDEGARVLAGRERDILPPAVRTRALRSLWVLLVVAGACLGVLVIVIGRLL